MSELQYLQLERHAAVALVRFNRPKVMNALCMGLMEELSQVFAELDADDSVAAIVLTGNDKSFAAGADIGEMKDATFEYMLEHGGMTRHCDSIAACGKPIIAAVAGYALGGGCELAMMCDFVIAADNAKFGQPEITIGTIPGFGGSQRLTRLVGKSKAMDMCLTGRMMDAPSAAAWHRGSRPSTNTWRSRCRPRQPSLATPARWCRWRSRPSTWRWKRHWRKASRASVRCSSRPSRSTTRKRAWRRSSTSASPNSRTARFSQVTDLFGAHR
jgi:hypothetical protein